MNTGTHISETGCHTLLDLYSGSGNYSLPFAGRVTSIDGFDDNQIGIDVANFNLRQNGIVNARYTCADAADALQRLLVGRLRGCQTWLFSTRRDSALAQKCRAC